MVWSSRGTSRSAWGSWGRSSSRRVSFTANCILFMELIKDVALISGVTIPRAIIRHKVTWAGSSTSA